MGIHEFLFFIGFLAFIFSMLALDLGVFSKSSKVVSFKEAGIWSLVWICLAIGFYFILKTHGDVIHGVENWEELSHLAKKYNVEKKLDYFSPNDYERSLQSYRENMALEFITGWLLEYSLSVDNIFVIMLIFVSFGVSETHYKKVLLWGILGAIVMRFIFIFAASELIEHYHWILYGFGLLLIYSGLKMFFDKEEEKIETENHKVVKLVSRYFSVYPRYVKNNFFVRKKGKLFITPLFLVVLIVEFTDLLFAVDSIPAITSITRDSYVIFFSNIFAIMGLRSMFFFLANVMHLFHYLKTGLAFLLTFIGIKMLAEHWMEQIGFKTEYFLYLILTILLTSILASIVFPKKEHKDHPMKV
jgi:tellurite resistance protein TerC